jgi:hypothetical protein
MASNGIHHVWLGDEDLGIFDEYKISLSDGYLIKGASGLNVKPFLEGIADLDPLSWQTLVWWLRRKQGKDMRRESIEFNFTDLRMEDEVDADPTPVPTGTSGAGISESSPTSAT